MSPSCGIKLRRQAVPPTAQAQRVSDVATDSDNRPLSRRVLDHVFESSQLNPNAQNN
jgi:hypothetical protein